MTMNTMSVRVAKSSFGPMIDIARAEPVLIEKNGCGVVVVVSMVECQPPSVQAERVGRGADRDA